MSSSAAYFKDWEFLGLHGFHVTDEEVDRRFCQELKPFRPTLDDHLHTMWNVIGAGKPFPLERKNGENMYAITEINPKVQVQIQQHSNGQNWVLQQIDGNRVSSTIAQFLEFVAKIPSLAVKHPKVPGALTLVGTNVIKTFATTHVARTNGGKVVEYSETSEDEDSVKKAPPIPSPIKAPPHAPHAMNFNNPLMQIQQEMAQLTAEYQRLYPIQFEQQNQRRMQEIQLRLNQLNMLTTQPMMMRPMYPPNKFHVAPPQSLGPKAAPQINLIDSVETDGASTRAPVTSKVVATKRPAPPKLKDSEEEEEEKKKRKKAMKKEKTKVEFDENDF